MDEPIVRSYYAIIPAEVRYDSRLQAGAKLLYGEISALCNDKGYCWAGNDYFASLYQTSERTVIRWINSLINSGHVKRKLEYYPNSKNVQKRYLIIGNFNQHECHCMSPGGDKNVTSSGDKSVTYPGDKNVMDNNTYINNTINNTYVRNFSETEKVSCNPSTKDVQHCINLWNNLADIGIIPVQRMSPSSTRAKQLRCRLREHGIDGYEKAIGNIKNSDYLQGKKGEVTWFNFDWFVKPNNFIKVLEGNYNNTSKVSLSKYAGMIFE